MFSGRTARWLLVVFVILLALYAAYPPVRLAKSRTTIVEKAGEPPVEQVQRSLWLVLAQEDPSKEITVSQRADGTLVREEVTYADGRIKLGLDIAGGTQLLYELRTQEGEKLTEAQLRQTINILRQRIDPQNIKEFGIQALGNDRILIQVPKAGRAEVERLKDRLTRMGLLEFKVALPHNDERFVDQYKRAEQNLPVSGYEKMYVEGDESKAFYLVEDIEARITGRSLADVSVSHDSLGKPAVGFRFDSQGSKTFSALTAEYRGWLVAIVLDDVLRSAPIIRTRIAGAGIIEGDFTTTEVQDLVTVLKAGSLPVDLQLLQESTVGPQLGRDSIMRGLSAILTAGLIVLAFIAVYYLGCGLVADAALVLNLVLLAGVLGLLGAALTLPGIAGVLLTIGMAVDANVLIFERIREESAAGKTLLIALRNGYDKAYTTIIDANVTTLLSAAILYVVGTGPVRGFAITLSFGIALSMFTSLFVTRLIFETLAAKGWLKSFKMLSLIGRPSFPYCRWRKPAFLLSGIVMLVGLVAFFSRGSDLYDIDFTGGSLVRIWLGKPTPISEVRDRLAAEGIPDAEVQGVHSPQATGEGTTDFFIRFKGAGREDVREAVKQQVEGGLRAAGLLAEDQSVTESSDGRSLEVKLDEAVGEMTLRKALSGTPGDPFNIEHIAEVTAEGDWPGGRILLRLDQKPPLVDHRDLWADMLGALARLGAESRPCRLELGEVQEQEGSAELELKTERPVRWELLAVEMLRREFPELQVRQEPEPATRFVLTGPREALERFRHEMADQEVNLPEARIEGLTVEATLPAGSDEPLLERDVRVACEQQGLGRISIVPLDGRFDHYTLALSYAEVKERMESIFADLGTKEVDAEFHALDQPAKGGWKRVEMELSQALTLPVVVHYLEAAGFGGKAQDMIVDSLEPHVATNKVTLRLPARKLEKAQELIAAAFREPHPVQMVDSIAARVAKEMKGRALLAVVCAAVVIIFYITVRFHAFRFGVAAVIALIHDIVIAVGLVALADWSGVIGNVKINLSMLAAFLTIMGYSLNDTIVVFDRIRENMVEAGRKVVNAQVIDRSLNQVLSRTVLTSVTTLAVVVVLFLMGGPVLQGLAFTLIVGIVVGTYSSIFIASPVLLDWPAIAKGTKVFFRLLSLPVRAPFVLARAARRLVTRA